MKVEVEWGLCDGNGMCALEAPAYFEVDDDDELVLLQDQVAPEDLDVVQRAVESCPKHALSLSAETG